MNATSSKQNEPEAFPSISRSKVRRGVGLSAAIPPEYRVEILHPAGMPAILFAHRASVMGLVTVICLLTTGCRQEMADQPRYEPLESSRIFDDGQSARRLVPGVVARGELRDDPHFFTGLKNAAASPETDQKEPSLNRADDYAETFPIAITPAVMQRGRERFNIYCAPCHDQSGDGAGPIVEHGYPQAESFHTNRLRQAPPGYFFDVITRGYQRMPSYANQIEPRDRWAVIAYIRALQLSRRADINELPESIRQQFAVHQGGER